MVRYIEKKTITSSGLELVTFRLVGQYVNQLRYRVPQSVCDGANYFHLADDPMARIGVHKRLDFHEQMRDQQLFKKLKTNS
jgi:hypothetical protein